MSREIWYSLLSMKPTALRNGNNNPMGILTSLWVVYKTRGREFRPQFDRIGALRAVASVPFMALTATASDSTYSAIVDSLHLDNPVLVSSSLNRVNIFLSVSPIENMSVSKGLSVCVGYIANDIDYCRKICVDYHDYYQRVTTWLSQRRLCLFNQRISLAKYIPF